MWKAWTKLAQANLDHYNEHPAQHNLLTVVFGVVGVVGTMVAARKVAEL